MLFAYFRKFRIIFLQILITRNIFNKFTPVLTLNMA